VRHAVLGSGGIGLLMAGALARAELPVTLLMRPQTRADYAGRVRVQSTVLGNFDVAVPADTRLRQPVDVVWITPKAYGLAESLAAVPAARVGRALVVPLMNGVEHMDLLRQTYPREQVVAGAIRVESARLAVDRVAQRSPFAVVSLVAAGPSAKEVRALATEVASTGLTVSVGDDEKTLLWSKLAILAPLALATSAVGGTVAAVKADPDVPDLLERCIEETVAVGKAEGGELDAAAISRMLSGFGGDFGTSMQRDLAAGKPLELDAIAGPIVRVGQKHGIPTPGTQQLIERVKARAARA
jgi:2-dehydropantoate 2-reductase